ncbi:MAG TPA: hypothetical protein VFW87_15350, partial [Pirellulales bacterium]|nr:hypothetical protein [Pirellulales bacterium]
MIHQIYCTHCTYGTSVLEQREGELAERVLGYSARAASLADRNELRGYYRQIERFLSYYLPSDTPPEEKPRLDAPSAPRRFFVLPSLGNLQMVGQVSYRATDTAGRVGSYFAHVVFAPRSSSGPTTSAWPTVEGLRLWQAPWVDQDSPDLPFGLPELERLDDLWAGARPALDDELVLRFLQTPAGETLDDPAEVVPPRWRSVPAAERIELLVNTLQGLLALGLPRRASVLVVMEPSVAALVFYGVARLLPAALLEGVSFSTFEPTTERLPVTVAATTFYHPDSSDVRPDLYRRGGLVLNTYTGRMSESGPPPGGYARFIVERLLADGWSNVDRLLESFEQAGAKRPEDLEMLAKTHPLISHVLSAEPLDDGAWRGSNVAANYLRQEVRHQLANAQPGWPELRQVVGSPNHLQVLELVAGESAPADLHGPAQFLVSKLPPEKFPELLASPRVAPSAKLDALQVYATRHSRLPDGCESLWADEMHPVVRPVGDHRPLIERLFTRLPEPVLAPLYEAVPDEFHKPRFLTLLRACRAESRNQAVLKRLLLQHLNDLNDVQFADTLVEHREGLRACFPPPEPALAERLGRLLYELPSHPKHFTKWLECLELWVAYFADPPLAEQRLADWRTVRQTLESLRDEAKPAVASRVDWLKSKWKPAAPRDLRALAEALGRAMRRRSAELDTLDDEIAQSHIAPGDVQRRLQVIARQLGVPTLMAAIPAQAAAAAVPDLFDGAPATQRTQSEDLLRGFEQRLFVYADDERGSRRQTVLRTLGMELLHRPDFLPEIFWTRLSRFFEYGDWAEGRAGGRGKKAKRPATIGPLFPMSQAKRKKRALPKHLWVILGAAATVIVLLGVGLEVAQRLRGTDEGQARPSDDAVAQHSAPKESSRRLAPSAQQKAAGNQRPRSQPVPPPKESADNSSSAKTAPPEEPTDQTPDRSADQPDEKQAHEQAAAPADKTKAPKMPDKTSAAPAAETAAVDADDAKPPAGAAADSPDSPSDDEPGGDTLRNEALDKQPPGKQPPGEEQPAVSDDPDEPDPAASPGITADPPDKGVPAFAGGPHAYETMLLWPWDAAPEKPKLILRGLEFVNRHLAGPGKMVATDTKEGLEVALVRGEDKPVPLATLQVTAKGLSFQWAEPGGNTHRARECQDFLRRCVVKVESAGPPLYIALSKPS